jgi:hypothetical protein
MRKGSGNNFREGMIPFEVTSFDILKGLAAPGFHKYCPELLPVQARRNSKRLNRRPQRIEVLCHACGQECCAESSWLCANRQPTPALKGER